MKRHKRKLKRFNRNIILIIILLLQVVLVAGCFYIFEFTSIPDYVAVIIFICVYVIMGIVILRLLYLPGDPEFKLSWAIAILGLPGAGVIIYLFFKQKGIKRKQRTTLENYYQGIKPFFQHKLTDDERHYDYHYDQPLVFLDKVSEFASSKDNQITYFKCGEEFFPDFIERLKEAKEFIFMEFFIIHEGKEWSKILRVLKQKVKEGVEVRLLYDDFGCFSTLPAGYDKELRKIGIQAYRFNKVGPILSGTYNNRSHRKIAVIDHTYAYTGGMNLGDEYANDIVRFGYWKDTMIRIEGQAINNLIALFLKNYDLNRCENSDYAKYLTFDYAKYDGGSLIAPFGTGPENVCPIRIGEQNYVNLIESSRKSLYISTPYFIPSMDLLHALQRAAYRGVDCHLIIPGIPDKKIVYLVAKYHIPMLQKCGIKVYFYTPGFNHMKTAVSDDNVAFVGTINMDYRSLVHHYECGATIVGGKVIAEIKSDLKDMVAKSELVAPDFSLNGFQKVFCAFLRIFMPLL